MDVPVGNHCAILGHGDPASMSDDRSVMLWFFFPKNRTGTDLDLIP